MRGQQQKQMLFFRTCLPGNAAAEKLDCYQNNHENVSKGNQKSHDRPIYHFHPHTYVLYLSTVEVIAEILQFQFMGKNSNLGPFFVILLRPFLVKAPILLQIPSRG